MDLIIPEDRNYYFSIVNGDTLRLSQGRVHRDSIKDVWIIEKMQKEKNRYWSKDPIQEKEHRILNHNFGNQHCEFEKEIDSTFLEPLKKEL